MSLQVDRKVRHSLIVLALAVAAAMVLVASVTMGSVALSWKALWTGLATRDSLAGALIYELRLPRALTAFAAGGVLALAGVLMQVLLRNPLADPYVMGISGGAAVGALTGILIGFSGVAVDAAAMTGALACTTPATCWGWRWPARCWSSHSPVTANNGLRSASCSPASSLPRAPARS